MSGFSHLAGRGIGSSRARPAAAQRLQKSAPSRTPPRPARTFVEAVESRLLFASLWVGDAVVVEGNAGTTDAVFTVTLLQPSGQAVTVNYATADSSANNPTDYQVTSGTLVFTPGGPTTRDVVVRVVGDTTQEANEQFSLNLSSPTNATLVAGNSNATGYIVDDDDAQLTIQNVNVREGDAGPTNAVFTVTRSGSTAGTTTVSYATSNSVATAPADYATTSGTLTFAPGETTKTITVAVAGDTLMEAEESFNVSLSNPTNGTVVTGNVVGSIVDDDASSVTIDSVYAPEGDADGGNLVFTVTRHGSLDGAASVGFQTQNGSALGGSDYLSTSGTLNFEPGVATRQITVGIVPNTDQEATEFFNVLLNTPNNVTIAQGQAEAQIVDDDAAGWVVEGGIAAEGDAGTTPLEFRVRRYGQVAGAATIQYATSNISATAPADYVTATGSLTFAAGEVVKTIAVAVNGDTAQEIDEIVGMTISAPSSGTIAESSAQSVIVDDDESFVAITPTSAVTVEGAAGAATPATFTVTRYGSLDGAASVNYATGNSTAQAGTDFTAASGTLAFAAGESSKTITVDVLGDATAEQNEMYIVSLTAPSNVTVAENTAFGWVANDDPPLGTAFVFIGDAVVAEGDAGITAATFTVTRTGNVAGAFTVNYTIPAPTAGDYQPATGTLSFAAGETQKTVTVNVVGDAVDETTEQYFVNLGTPSAGAQVADNSGTLTIIDDDDIVLYVGDASIAEGDDPLGRELRFTLRRFGDTGGESTVNFATQNSSALTPLDYQTASGTAVFAAGESTKDVVVRVIGDATQESFESFFVNLTAPTNGAVVGGNGQGTILDDDLSVLVVGDVTVLEGTGGAGTTATFTVARFGSTDGPASVNFIANPVTATSPADFAATSGTLAFAAGQTTATVSVQVVADSLEEPIEQFVLDLNTASNATIGDGRAFARIVDDDDSTVLATGVAVVEGNDGTRQAVFTLTRYGSQGGTSSVDFRTSNNSATAPGDYTQTTQTVTFVPGDDTETVSVPILGDTVQEPNELFTATLVNPVNTTAGTGANPFGYILDDDASFLFIDNAVAEEGSEAVPAGMVLTVRRFGSLAGTSMVNFATSPNSATTPADFTTTSGTLTFAPGESLKTITVPVAGDTARELEELFFVSLSAATNATIVDPTGRAVIIDDDPAPAVTRVYAGSTNWVGVDNNTNATSFKEHLQAMNLGSVAYGYAIPAGADQLLTLPWINLNQVSITFSQPVEVQKDDLSVRGINVPNYAFAAGPAGFTYDAPTRTATWTFDQPLARDRILLDLDAAAPGGVRNAAGEYLDGEWANGADAYPSGNGAGGGDFLFRLNVLPGDTLRDNTVLARDYADVKKKFFKNTASPATGADTDYNAFYDIDGSGSILATDYAEVKRRFFSQLPATQPASAGLFGATRIGAAAHRDLLA